MNLKTYRDYKNTVDTAYDDGLLEGKVEGKIEGKIEVAKILKQNGVALSIISISTGLTEEQISKLNFIKITTLKHCFNDFLFSLSSTTF